MARVRSEKYSQKCKQFSLFLRDVYSEENISVEDEAFLFDCSDQQVRNFTDPISDSEMPAALVTTSRGAKRIIRQLAHELGLDVIDTNHKLNGRINDEVSKTMKGLSNIVKFIDNPERILRETGILKELIETIEEEVKNILSKKQ